jgi:hypothetical protein
LSDETALAPAPVTHDAPVTSSRPDFGVEQAAQELHERRSAGTVPQPEKSKEDDDPTDIAEIRYPDDRDVSTRQAARDLTAFRQQQRDMLSALDGLEQRAASEAQPAAEVKPAEQQSEPQPDAPKTKMAHQMVHEASQRAAENPELAQFAQDIDRQVRSEAATYSRGLSEAYARNGEMLQTLTGAVLKSVFGGTDPAQLAKTNPAAAQVLEQTLRVYQALDAERKNFQELSTKEAAEQQQVWARNQDRLAISLIGNDAQDLSKDVPAYLKSYGFDESEVAGLYKMGVDHRSQAILADAIRFRRAQAAARNKVAKPLPPVQRPGTLSARQVVNPAAGYEQRLNASGSIRDAVALIRARRGG